MIWPCSTQCHCGTLLDCAHNITIPKVYGKPKNEILADGIEISVCGAKRDPGSPDKVPFTDAASTAESNSTSESGIQSAWAAFGSDSDSDDDEAAENATPEKTPEEAS